MSLAFRACTGFGNRDQGWKQEVQGPSLPGQVFCAPGDGVSPLRWLFRTVGKPQLCLVDLILSCLPSITEPETFSIRYGTHTLVHCTALYCTVQYLYCAVLYFIMPRNCQADYSYIHTALFCEALSAHVVLQSDTAPVLGSLQTWMESRVKGTHCQATSKCSAWGEQRALPLVCLRALGRRLLVCLWYFSLYAPVSPGMLLVCLSMSSKW